MAAPAAPRRSSDEPRRSSDEPPRPPPPAQDDPLYHEAVTHSLVLIQRRWRERCVRKRSRPAPRSAAPAASEGGGGSADWSGAELGGTLASLRRIQAIFRAKRVRNRIEQTEEQIMAQAAAIAQRSAAVNHPPTHRPSVVPMLRRDEQVLYLIELESRQAHLRAGIHQLEVEAVYRSAGDQRQMAMKVKQMRRQLEDLAHEIKFVKAAPAASHASLHVSTGARNSVATTNATSASNPAIAPTSLLPRIIATRHQHRNGTSCRIELRLSFAPRPTPSVRINLMAIGAGVDVRITPFEATVASCIQANLTVVHPPPMALFAQRKLKEVRAELAAALIDPSMQTSVVQTALIKLQESSDNAVKVFPTSWVIARMRQLDEDLEPLRLHLRMVRRCDERVGQQLVSQRQRVIQLSHTEMRKAFPARERMARRDLRALEKRSAELQHFNALLTMMVHLLQEERSFLRHSLMGRLVRKHLTIAQGERHRVLQVLKIQAAIRARQARTMLRLLKHAVGISRARRQQNERKTKLHALWAAAGEGVKLGTRSTRRNAAAMIIQSGFRTLRFSRREHEEAFTKFSRAEFLRRAWALKRTPERRQAQVKRLLALEAHYQEMVSKTRKFDPFLRESNEPEAAQLEAATMRESVQARTVRATLEAAETAREISRCSSKRSVLPMVVPSWDEAHAFEMSSPLKRNQHSGSLLTARADVQCPPSQQARSLTSAPPPLIPTPPSSSRSHPSPRLAPRPHACSQCHRASATSLTSSHGLAACGSPPSPMERRHIALKHQGTLTHTRGTLEEQELLEVKAIQSSLERIVRATGPSAELIAANCHALGTSIAETIRLARIAAAPAPTFSPERVRVERARLFEVKRHYLPGGNTSNTGRLASLWEDGGLKAAKAKQTRAELELWRKQHEVWRRSRGLRRELLMREEQRRVVELERSEREEARIFMRMQKWEREDTAAITIQDAWRALHSIRRKYKQMESLHDFRVLQLQRLRTLDPHALKAPAPMVTHRLSIRCPHLTQSITPTQESRRAVQELSSKPTLWPKEARGLASTRRPSLASRLQSDWNREGQVVGALTTEVLREISKQLDDCMLPIEGKALLQAHAAKKVQAAYKLYCLRKVMRQIRLQRA